MNLKELKEFRILIKSAKTFSELATFTEGNKENLKFLELSKDVILTNINNKIKNNEFEDNKKKIKELEAIIDIKENEIAEKRKQLKHLKTK